VNEARVLVIWVALALLSMMFLYQISAVLAVVPNVVLVLVVVLVAVLYSVASY